MKTKQYSREKEEYNAMKNNQAIKIVVEVFLLREFL